MSGFVVDTNVAVVANGRTLQAGPACVTACVAALRAARDGIVVLDDGRRIIREYMNNRIRSRIFEVILVDSGALGYVVRHYGGSQNGKWLPSLC